MIERRRRLVAVVFVVLLFLLGFSYEATSDLLDQPQIKPAVLSSSDDVNTELAEEALEQLDVKGRAPKTGYSRDNFGDGWQNAGQCDVRNFVLNRDLVDVKHVSDEDCTVLSGILYDPYTAQTINFVRGYDTSDDVQIDHVVALSDAWQKGAQQLSFDRRVQFANDSLNLLAVDGSANQQKSNSDSASWLPPNKAYRCQYVARQIAVKQKYDLWITSAEKQAMKSVLGKCQDQKLPLVSS